MPKIHVSHQAQPNLSESEHGPLALESEWEHLDYEDDLPHLPHLPNYTRQQAC